MNPYTLIEKYYPEENRLREILITHSRSVANRALQIAEKHVELQLDKQFIEEAAMLHDIGIFETQAPSICCFGTEPYICHGLLGGKLLRQEGFPRHARVCERHTGTGITREMIEKQNLPLPHEDFVPVTLEEQLICYADKFYNKTHLERELTIEQARESLRKFGEEGIQRFDQWTILFSE